MSRIVIFIPYPEMEDVFEEMRADCPVDFEIISAICEEAIPIAEEKLREGVKVFIARGETAKLLKNAPLNSEAIVVEIPITDYDRIRMLTKAMKDSKKIAIVGFEVSRALASFIGHIVDRNIRINFYHLSKSSQIRDMCRRIVEDGYEVIAGTPQVVNQAAKFGVIGIPLLTAPSTLQATLEEAVKTVRFLENDYRESRLKPAPHTLIIDYNDNFIRENPDIDPGLKKRISSKCKFIVKGESLYDSMIGDNGRKIHYIINYIDNVEKNIRAVCHFCEDARMAPSKEKDNFSNFITRSPRLVKTLKVLSEIAHTDAPLVLLGETGTGKSLIAKILHAQSSRYRKPFIGFNCASLPENLIESELFGYAAGAFTGSSPRGKKGFCALADAGTLFLDEISELSLAAQAKILKFIEDKTFFPVGAEKALSVNVRIICASNKSLRNMAARKLFRNDLYYRLSVFEITIPPLRERPEDIEPLALAFLSELNEKYQAEARLSRSDWHILKSLSYPGNVRELHSLLERAVLGSRVGLGFEEAINRETQEENGIQSMNLEEVEEKYIRRALELSKDNRKKAAQMLGISTATLWRKCVKLHL